MRFRTVSEIGIIFFVFLTPACGSKIPAPQGPTLNPALPPSGNFDLTGWYLTLPTGTAGHPDTVKNLLGYSNPPYFYTASDGSMAFYCPTNGVTTSGSSNPRTELRETKSGNNFNWSLSSFGDSKLNATLLVSQVPPSGRIVVGQIHDVGGTDGFGNTVTDQPLLKLEYDANPTDTNGNHCNGCLYAEIRPTPATASSAQIDSTIVTDIALKTQFSYSIDLTSGGLLSVTVNSAVYNLRLNTSPNFTVGWGDNLAAGILSGGGLYFKAGDYVQDSTPASGFGGGVQFYSLEVVHK